MVNIWESASLTPETVTLSYAAYVELRKAAARDRAVLTYTREVGDNTDELSLDRLNEVRRTAKVWLV